MKWTWKLFLVGLKQIRRDGMLLILLPAPIATGLFFKFLLPVANRELETWFSFSIAPWYRLVDGLLLCLAPMFSAIICAFLLNDERDEGLGAYYQITPAAGYAYLMARIGIPMLWSFLLSFLLGGLLGLSGLPLAVTAAAALLSSLCGGGLAMMVASLAGNRVEGLALSKLAGFSFAGLLAVWFLPYPYHYLAAFLPSFWIGVIIKDGSSFGCVLLGVLSSSLWIFLFSRKFLSRSS